MFDLEISKDQAQAFVRAHGWDAMLDALNMLCGNGRELYSVGTTWRDGVMEARGTRGDLMIKLSE
jgi:hypothetical protein